MSAAHTGRMYYSPGWFVQRLGTLGQFKTRREALCLTRFGLLCCERRHCQRKPGKQVQHLQQQLSTTVRDEKRYFCFHVAGAEVLSGSAGSWSALLLQLPGPNRVCALGDVQPAHQHLHQGPEGEVRSRKKQQDITSHSVGIDLATNKYPSYLISLSPIWHLFLNWILWFCGDFSYSCRKFCLLCIFSN